MATVKIYIRVTVDGKRRYVPTQYTANHKIRPGYALVDGKPQHFPGCSYFLRYSLGKKRVWQLVGDASAVPALQPQRDLRALGAKRDQDQAGCSRPSRAFCGSVNRRAVWDAS